MEQSLDYRAADLHVVTIDTTIDHAYAMSNPSITNNTSGAIPLTTNSKKGKTKTSKIKSAVRNMCAKKSSFKSAPTFTPSLTASCGVLPRWSGRNHRGKINIHVNLESFLNISPYLYSKRMRHHRRPTTNAAQLLGKRSVGHSDSVNSMTGCFKLTSVIMHHGRGFGSGHYTAFCYNKEAG